MRGFAKILLAAAAMAAGVSASATSVFVTAGSSTPTLLGTLAAGVLYDFTVTGTASLCISCNDGGKLNFTADGKPSGPLSVGYAPFFPNGLDHDPTGSGIGIAGPGNLVGALFVSNTATPTPADLFATGLAGTITSASGGAFYGLINDTVYNDNDSQSGYTFTFTAQGVGGVPEPATWALMLGGFGAVGLTARRRARQAVLA